MGLKRKEVDVDYLRKKFRDLVDDDVPVPPQETKLPQPEPTHIVPQPQHSQELVDSLVKQVQDLVELNTTLSNQVRELDQKVELHAAEKKDSGSDEYIQHIAELRAEIETLKQAAQSQPPSQVQSTSHVPITQPTQAVPAPHQMNEFMTHMNTLVHNQVKNMVDLGVSITQSVNESLKDSIQESVQQTVQRKLTQKNWKDDSVHENHHFYLSNGQVVRSVQDLIYALRLMDSTTYTQHVNEFKNDFEKWMRYAVGNENLANEMRRTRQKDAMIKLLERA